ncbi:MAG: hypothetical protein Ta2E_08150 [Mycoplasmoidaceae bacterium]|nr:MAG: hypothetical protein Ta2E_08150 [Mycoplasmoidaceae bacterium]
MLIEQLSFLKSLTDELQNNNSSNDKKVILSKYLNKNEELFNKLMDYVFSYDKKYWITSDNISKLWDKFNIKYKFSSSDDLFLILNKIINREITGHDAINYIIDLIKFAGDEYKNTINNIINKDLKANVNVSLVNNVSPNAVKQFKVSLAERNDEAPKIHQINFDKQSWMVSRKLDGVRTIAVNENGQVKFYSRTGSDFTTLSSLTPQVTAILKAAEKKYNEQFVLDGECCMMNENDRENFSGIMKEITRKNHTIVSPNYVVFDFIKKKEFEKGIGTTPFKQRMKMLEELNIESFGSFVKLIPHSNSIDNVVYMKWLEKSKKEGWEGLMLRDENSCYTAKRSYDLQKIKSFFDAEYKVIGLEEGTKKMLDKNGVMKEVNCIKSLVIEHKGYHINVGSGISDQERITWKENPALIMGCIVTVQYFEETTDSKTGEPSLRFPTLKIVHGKERQV